MTALASSPPTPSTSSTLCYDDVQGFLFSIVEWLQLASARLRCSRQSAALAATLDALVAYHQHKTHSANSPSSSSSGPSFAVPQHVLQWTGLGAATDPSAAAALSLQLSVLVSALVLILLWCAIFRILSWSLPGLRARRQAARAQAWLQRTDAAIQKDALLGQLTGSMRHRSNHHQLVSAAASTAVAAALIGLLLTVHFWTGVVMSRVWELCSSPLRQAWQWAGAVSLRLLPPPLAISFSATDGITTAAAAAAASSPLFFSSLVETIAAGPGLVWSLVHDLQVWYLWHVAGSGVLGLSLWLLSFAQQRMHTFNASLAWVTSRDSEPPLLHKLRETVNDRRHRAVLQLQVETLRINQLLMERMAAAQREPQRLVAASREEGENGGELLSVARLEDRSATTRTTTGERESTNDDAAAASASRDRREGSESPAAAAAVGNAAVNVSHAVCVGGDAKPLQSSALALAENRKGTEWSGEAAEAKTAVGSGTLPADETEAAGGSGAHDAESGAAGAG